MTLLVCDGCGLAASAEHIAARIARLEWATRYRPIHIQALFVKERPGPSRESDYSALLDALEIRGDAQNGEGDFAARLVEFQRRGFCLIHLTECPLEEGDNSSAESLCQRLGPTLVRRIRFSYRPKHVVLLSGTLRPLVRELQEAGLGDLLLLEKPLDNSPNGSLNESLNQGQPLELPHAGDSAKPDGQSAWQHLKGLC